MPIGIPWLLLLIKLFGGEVKYVRGTIRRQGLVARIRNQCAPASIHRGMVIRPDSVSSDENVEIRRNIRRIRKGVVVGVHRCREISFSGEEHVHDIVNTVGIAVVVSMQEPRRICRPCYCRNRRIHVKVFTVGPGCPCKVSVTQKCCHDVSGTFVE